ncbi:MAG: hypothetical protein R3C51_13035 [Parvularculaceae bacterium]
MTIKRRSPNRALMALAAAGRSDNAVGRFGGDPGAFQHKVFKAHVDAGVGQALLGEARQHRDSENFQPPVVAAPGDGALGQRRARRNVGGKSPPFTAF